jgi:hypothetical protein
MFVREKRIGRYTHVYLVETVREDDRIKQRIIRSLGRQEDVERRGDLDRLVRSATRLAQRSMILSLIEDGSVPTLSCKRIGPPLLFERLWRDTGCREVLEELSADRRFEFPVERAVFLTVLHRLMVSDSDRACEQWRDDYRIDGVDSLQLHHLYRAMAWLGEERPTDDQADRTLVARCTKDLVEENLFGRRRSLFSDLSVVFMDTTSLYFEGEHGATLGERGDLEKLFPRHQREDRVITIPLAVTSGDQRGTDARVETNFFVDGPRVGLHAGPRPCETLRRPGGQTGRWPGRLDWY